MRKNQVSYRLGMNSGVIQRETKTNSAGVDLQPDFFGKLPRRCLGQSSFEIGTVLGFCQPTRKDPSVTEDATGWTASHQNSK